MCSQNHAVHRAVDRRRLSRCREHIVRISMKQQRCGRLGTSSCIVCSISYCRSVANVDDGVEAVMAIVVERWGCSARRSFVRAVVCGEQTHCTGRSGHYSSPGAMWYKRVWDCVSSRCLRGAEFSEYDVDDNNTPLHSIVPDRQNLAHCLAVGLLQGYGQR